MVSPYFQFVMSMRSSYEALHVKAVDIVIQAAINSLLNQRRQIEERRRSVGCDEVHAKMQSCLRASDTCKCSPTLHQAAFRLQTKEERFHEQHGRILLRLLLLLLFLRLLLLLFPIEKHINDRYDFQNSRVSIDVSSKQQRNSYQKASKWREKQK